MEWNDLTIKERTSEKLRFNFIMELLEEVMPEFTVSLSLARQDYPSPVVKFDGTTISSPYTINNVRTGNHHVECVAAGYYEYDEIIRFTPSSYTHTITLAPAQYSFVFTEPYYQDESFVMKFDGEEIEFTL